MLMLLVIRNVIAKGYKKSKKKSANVIDGGFYVYLKRINLVLAFCFDRHLCGGHQMDAAYARRILRGFLKEPF